MKWWGAMMFFNKIIWRAGDTLRADQWAVIGIKLSREVKQEAGPSVGARAVDEGVGGPLWSPAAGDTSVFLQEVSQGNRTRATIKALPAALHPPSPLRSTHLHFVSLIRMRADQSP